MPDTCSGIWWKGTRVVVLHDDGAQAPKHVAETHQIYVCNRYCSFSWYWKGVWWCRDDSTKASVTPGVGGPGIESALRSSLMLKDSHVLAKHSACSHSRKVSNDPRSELIYWDSSMTLHIFPSVLHSSTTKNIPQSLRATFKIVLISQLNEFFRVKRTFSESLTPVLRSSRQQQ